MIKASDFIHPEDSAALRQMESIPGFPALIKKFLSIGFEQLQYGVNMASTIRLSEKQLPELYRHLPPICDKLGIAEPEFYLQMDPNPNAWTFGDSRIYITITSGLVEMMSDCELDAVLAHECGHILCRHVLYHSVASYILKGIDNLGILGSLTTPIQFAILYWQRKSELSCDRVASIITSPEIVSSTMARLAGGPSSITKDINLEEWAKQGDEYESIRTDGLWNKALQVGAIMTQNHPFTAVRVREILKWSESDQFKAIRLNLQTQSTNSCPACRQPIKTEWKFCKHCGNKLI
jgi:Zn-dependent protease with chaperone function